MFGVVLPPSHHRTSGPDARAFDTPDTSPKSRSKGSQNCSANSNSCSSIAEVRYLSPVTRREQPPLSDDERDAIVLAVKSAFTKLRNLYQEITPIIQKYG